jgi:hypothetical protein
MSKSQVKNNGHKSSCPLYLILTHREADKCWPNRPSCNCQCTNCGRSHFLSPVTTPKGTTVRQPDLTISLSGKRGASASCQCQRCEHAWIVTEVDWWYENEPSWNRAAWNLEMGWTKCGCDATNLSIARSAGG